MECKFVFYSVAFSVYIDDLWFLSQKIQHECIGCMVHVSMVFIFACPEKDEWIDRISVVLIRNTDYTTNSKWKQNNGLTKIVIYIPCIATSTMFRDKLVRICRHAYRFNIINRKVNVKIRNVAPVTLGLLTTVSCEEKQRKDLSWDPDSLEHEFLIRQATTVSVNAATQLLTVTLVAVQDTSERYAMI